MYRTKKQRALSLALTCLALALLLPMAFWGTAAPDTLIQPAGNGLISYSNESYRVNSESSDDAYIDLNAETLHLPSSFIDMAYSVDGGSKWKVSPLSNAQLQSLLNKNMTLWLTSEYDETAKKPAEGATVVKFPAISGRPKASKLVVNYTIYASGEARWTLSEKDGTADKTAGLQVAYANGSNPSSKGWGSFDSQGMKFKEGKTKLSYLVRTPPVASGSYTAASKAYKVTPATIPAAPKVKADYNNEVIKLKDNYMIFGGPASQIPSGNPVEVTADTPISTTQVLAVKNSKGVSISIADFLKTGTTTVTIWVRANAKSPESQKLEYTLAPRAEITAQTLSPSAGKLTLDKSFEVRAEGSSEKWGSLPAITANAVFDIRVKSTAKATGTVDTGNAASTIKKLRLTYGEITAATEDKPAVNGILTAVIE